MEKLVYIAGLIISLSMFNISCQKQDTFSEQEQDQENPSMNPTGDLIKICHNTGNSYDVIEIDEDAWPGHEAHGDILYEEFPKVGVYRWVFDFGETNQLNTMFITEVTETTFTGYGKDHENDRDWDIVDGTIYEDDSFSFTIDYQNSGDYLECSGSYVCGEGMLGNFGGTESGSLVGHYAGGFLEYWEAIDIGP